MVGKIDGSILANILNLDSTTIRPLGRITPQTIEFHLDGMPTIRPSGLGDRSYTPDFESGLENASFAGLGL